MLIKDSFTNMLGTLMNASGNRGVELFPRREGCNDGLSVCKNFGVGAGSSDTHTSILRIFCRRVNGKSLCDWSNCSSQPFQACIRSFRDELHNNPIQQCRQCGSCDWPD